MRSSYHRNSFMPPVTNKKKWQKNKKMKRQKKSYVRIKYIQVDNMRVLVLCIKYGWLTMPGRIYSAPSVISTKHTNWTTSVGTWLHSAEQQAGKLRVNKMEAQTWPIHVRNYMVTSSFYDDQYKELFFDFKDSSICVIFLYNVLCDTL